MRITISGSMQHEPRMAEVAEVLTARGYDVQKPSSADREGETAVGAALKRRLINKHFAKIDASEALLVVNEAKNGVDHYIGGNTLIEMACAYGQGLDVYLLNPVPDMSYTDEIRGMDPIMLGGNLDALDAHVESLPLAYMSTTNTLKHTAVARAMRRAGFPVRVGGAKVESGVSEQPFSLDEIYEGAMNRHAALKKLGESAAYFVTVESGLHPVHGDYRRFGCNVVIIEPAHGAQRVGVGLDVEFPKAMLSRVPSEYPDLGILVQKEYGAKEKDPYPYITNGKMTRRETIENTAYDVAIQLGVEHQANSNPQKSVGNFTTKSAGITLYAAYNK